MTTPHGAPELVSNSPIVHDPQQWGPILELPCKLTLDLPIPDFSVADLLRLRIGTVLDTGWSNGDDVPVRVNEELIAWAEFEVLANCLAVRLTEWA